MSVFSEHDKRFEGLEPRAGLFLAVAALIIAATVVASLIKHDAFTPTMHVNFYAQSAQGIHKGMAVQLSGFRIGSVQELRIEPDARVKVTLLIGKEYAGLIPQDSYLGLSKEGLIGGTFIEIEPGQDKARTIGEDGVLRFYRAIDFSDMAQELKEKLDPILADVKKVTQSVNDPDGDIRKTIANAREASAQLAEMARRVSEFTKQRESQVNAIADKAERVLDQTSATLERARGAMDTAARSLETVDRQLPSLLLRLDRSLANVESVTADARRLSSSLSDELPPAIRDGRVLIQDTQEIVEGAKQSWPVRNFVAPAAEKALPLDSHDGGGTK